MCERLCAMQEQASLPEFLAHFAKNTLCPWKCPLSSDPLTKFAQRNNFLYHTEVNHYLFTFLVTFVYFTVRWCRWDPGAWLAGDVERDSLRKRKWSIPTAKSGTPSVSCKCDVQGNMQSCKVKQLKWKHLSKLDSLNLVQTPNGATFNNAKISKNKDPSTFYINIMQNCHVIHYSLLYHGLLKHLLHPALETKV